MEKWQATVLFWVAIIGVFLVFFADQIGVELDTLKLSGFFAVTTYVLSTDRNWSWLSNKKKKDTDKEPSHRRDQDEK